MLLSGCRAAAHVVSCDAAATASAAEQCSAIAQEINKRASEKPRLMTGTTWQPAATCGEADCSEDERSQAEQGEDDSADASASLGGDTSDEGASSEGDASSFDAASAEYAPQEE